MTVPQKAALSLLISVFLFAGIAIFAYTGLFDLIETRFYSSSMTRSLSRETKKDTQLIQDFLANLQSRFSSSLGEPAVRRSFLPNQSAEDIYERTRIFGMFLESISGLQWVRFVDHNGVRLHFSTFTQDILSQDRLFVAYRNYPDDAGNLPFEQVQTSALSDDMLINIDSAADRIIFSFPFFDSLDVYRGTALFSISIRALGELLISENRIKIGEDVSLISNPPGIISGSPGISKTEIASNVASIWNDGLFTATPFVSSDGITLVLISAKTGQGIFYGRLINESIFAFPQPMKIILLLCIIFTIYLALFLILSLKQDNLIIVQNRLKNMHISLIEQYYERKGDIDWEHWNMELEQRREDVREEVKRGIKIKHRQSEENIDTLIDKSWDELIAVIGSRKKPEAGFDGEKLQDILRRVLQVIPQTALAYTSGGPAQPIRAEALPAEKIDAVEPIHELEELDEAEDVEILDEAEVAEPIDEAGDVEVLDEIAELDEAAEIIGEIETPPMNTNKPRGLLALAEEKKQAKSQAAPESFIHADSPEMPSAAVTQPVSEEQTIHAKEALYPHDAHLACSDDELGEIEELEVLEEIDDANEMDELEELEGVEEPEEQKELAASEESSGPAPAGRGMSEIDMLASAIEFNPDIGSKTDEKELVLDEDLEIVSPFASIMPAFDDTKHEKNNYDAEETVIEEREGLNFINEDILSPDRKPEENINLDFKDLVDSVLKP